MLIGFRFALGLELELQVVRFDVNEWLSSARLSLKKLSGVKFQIKKRIYL
jgi:hypothetical protein